MISFFSSFKCDPSYSSDISCQLHAVEISVSAVVALTALFLLHRWYWKVFKSPSAKGKAGEKLVASVLRLLPKEYQVYNNVYIRNTKGELVQIDHLVMSPGGAIILETKNLSGTLLGTTFDNKWQQIAGKRTYHMMSPVIQNQYHVEAFKSAIKSNNYPVASVVCLTGNCVSHIIADKYSVIRTNEILVAIEYHSRHQVNIKDYLEVLTKVSLTVSKENSKIKYQHTRSVSRKKADSLYISGLGACPKCGNELARRQGRHGPFIGCNNYPTCKYTADFPK